jgi:hypothetical protein
VPAGPQALVFEAFLFQGLPDLLWACFEPCPYDPAKSTFASLILEVGAMRAVPSRKSTWGQVKALYH